VNVPGFLVRQFYVKGSLRNVDGGFELQARNGMGDGSLVGVGSLRVDGQPIAPEQVSAARDDGSEPVRASDVDRQRPIRVAQGDRVTLHVDGIQLDPGEHRLEVELYELNMGRLRFSVSDRLAEE
jgi:hypothetical protein